VAVVIINIRGPNGSGKSTIVRRLLEQCEPVSPIYGLSLGPRVPEAYEMAVPGTKVPLFVIGPYRTQCGGADAIRPFALIPMLIEKYAARGHVVFEGVLISTTYGIVGRLMEQWGKQSVLLFLDTPPAECIRRVNKRRIDGDTCRPFNPQNVIGKARAIERVRQRVIGDGIMEAASVSAEEAPAMIINMLGGSSQIGQQKVPRSIKLSGLR
jgi:hypothetical protein